MDVLFNEKNLEDEVTGLRILSRNPYTLPERDISIFPLARQDKSVITSDFYTQKTITIEAAITRDSRENFEKSVDALTVLLTKRDADLRLVYAGDVRIFTATQSQAVFSNTGGGFGRVTIAFLCADPMGRNILPNTVLNVSSITADSSTQSVTFLGSARNQFPKFQLDFTTVTGSGVVKLTNDDSGAEATFTETFASGDTLIVNTADTEATLNGNTISWSGKLPLFEPGTGSFRYDDTLSTRDVDIKITQVPRWL